MSGRSFLTVGQKLFLSFEKWIKYSPFNLNFKAPSQYLLIFDKPFFIVLSLLKASPPLYLCVQLCSVLYEQPVNAPGPKVGFPPLFAVVCGVGALPFPIRTAQTNARLLRSGTRRDQIRSRMLSGQTWPLYCHGFQPSHGTRTLCVDAGQEQTVDRSAPSLTQFLSWGCSVVVEAVKANLCFWKPRLLQNCMTCSRKASIDPTPRIYGSFQPTSRVKAQRGPLFAA